MDMDELDTSVKSEPDEEGGNRFLIDYENREDCRGTGRCLFCTGKHSKRLWDIGLPSLQGSQGNSVVNHHLWSVFILRNLLQYPKGKMTKLLKKTKEIPLEHWFGLCESCIEIVREAMIVFDKLLKLATQFKKFKKEVKRKIQESLQRDQESLGDAISVAVEIRNYFKADLSILNSTVPEPVNSDVLNADIKEENDIPSNRPNSIVVSTIEVIQASSHLQLQKENDEYEDEPVLPPDDYDDSCDETDPLYIPSSVSSAKSNKSTRKSFSTRYPKVDGKKIPTPKKKLGNQLKKLFKQVKNKPGLFACKICLCERNYSCKSSYNLHMKQHRLNKYPCRKCKYPYSSASRMKSHLKKCSFKKIDHSQATQNKTESLADPLKENSNSDNEDYDEEWPLVNGNEDDEDVIEKTSPPTTTSTTEIKSVSADGTKKISQPQTKKFHCKLCLTKRFFGNAWSYEKHKRLHRLSKYPCPKCRYPCQTDSALKWHLKQNICNNRTIIYKCEFCDFETISGSSECLEHRNMHRHEQKNKKLENELGVIDTNEKVIKDGKIYCKICIGQRKFKSSTYYAKHLLHHRYRRYPCPKCKFPCKSENHLESHRFRGRCGLSEKKQQNKKTRRKYQCNLCDFGPDTFTAMARHKKDAHKRVPQTEEQRKMKRREWHRRREESALTTFFNCHLCPYKTKNQRILNAHVKRHELYDCEQVDGKLKCKFCGDLFRGPLALKRHVRGTHTEKLDIPLFECSFCGINLCQKDSLRNHIAEVHTKQCDYYCEICGYGTMTKNSLVRHMQQHDPVRSFVCELCAAPFNTSRSLHTHMKRVHCPSRKEVALVCKYCNGNEKDKLFFNKSLLNRHMMEVHKDLYVHKCDECEKRYLSVASLQLHKKINHSGEKAECQFCQTKVLNRVYLYNHYRACQKTPADFKYTYPRK